MANENMLEESIKKLRNFWQNRFKIKSLEGMSIEVMKKASTYRKQFFKEYSFSMSVSGLNRSEETILIQNQLLSREGDEQISLTLKGMIVLGYDIDISDYRNNKFLDDLNNKYFNVLKTRTESSLQGQEKAVIITLIGLLAFTKNSSLSLSRFNADYSNAEEVKQCVNKSINFLKSLGTKYIDNTMDNIWDSNVRGEDPVSAKFSRLNDIALKTNNIYKKVGGRHFLDLMNNNNFKEEKFECLLKKLFNCGFLDSRKREEFIELLDEIFSARYNIINEVPDFDQLMVKYKIADCVRTFEQ